MTIIVCVDRNWAIGREGQLLFRIPADMARFRELTMGYVLLMGRRTFESLPGPLPGRTHVVLSRDTGFASPGVTVCRSLEESMAAAKALGEVFVIGGGKVYAALLPYCERALVTQVDAAAPAADTFFPNLDEHPRWRLIDAGEWQEEAGLRFRYCEHTQREIYCG